MLSIIMVNIDSIQVLYTWKEVIEACNPWTPPGLYRDSAQDLEFSFNLHNSYSD